MSTLKESFGKYFFGAVILGLVIPLFISGTEQGDFKTFYAGATAYRQNLNPYDTANLVRIMGGTSPIAAYVYPPITFLFFEPLTLIPYQAASIIYLAIKLLALFFFDLPLV